MVVVCPRTKGYPDARVSGDLRGNTTTVFLTAGGEKAAVKSIRAYVMPAQQVPQQGSELPQAAAAAAAAAGCTAPAPSSPTGQVAAKEAMLNAAAVQVYLPPAPADAPMATAQQPAATVDPPPASVAPASPACQLPVSTRPQHFTLTGSCDVRHGS